MSQTGLQGSKEREQWKSRVGFMLAALGSAVGLGNIWRFAYVTGENGGAAFLIIYLVCVTLIGLPIVLAEFAIGRKTQSDAVGSFVKLAPGKPWVLAGILGVASAFIILSFYAVISGWSLKYLFGYVTGELWSTPATGYEGFFSDFTASPLEPLIWQSIFMFFTIGIVLAGVKKGLELSNKILMPALAILVISLAIYSVSLEGSSEGLRFLFSPDWSAFSDPNVYLAALGQAFFSLSLGMGALITYASYLSKKERLPGVTVGVATMDTMFAIVAGVMIFPAVFAFGGEPGSGPGLVFMTLPNIFNSMAIGGVIGLAFFLLLTAAALSSAISLLEVAVAYFIRKFNWSRKKATLLIGGVIYILGIPSSLGYGLLSDIKIFGERDILDSLDFLASDIFLPLGGLIIALFVGWGWNKAEALKESDLGRTALGKVWYNLLKYVAPIAILLVFLQASGLLAFFGLGGE
ncbi:sodium-dependent transporter [Bacillus horti]|uniref:Transporter n=1 Tax=Caldalkalibacillus horti TaxID=77523 RepID=A0ABT9W1W0_9BACI|nr:sodium-dependent transporter [Bacillus horti]MDQ0167243.1 NSS family neurotransmitter:Na+ symporter [Bacillus horti]